MTRQNRLIASLLDLWNEDSSKICNNEKAKCQRVVLGTYSYFENNAISCETLICFVLKVASSPRLSGIGMPSPILWSHPLKMQRIVLLSSLLWWELGTNYLIIGPGEWLSFRRFSSKLSWSWCVSAIIMRTTVDSNILKGDFSFHVPEGFPM